MTLWLALPFVAGLGRGWALDVETAAALAASGAKLYADGKGEKAKALCYKALAHHEGCPEALLTLGMVFEREGNGAAAATFFQQAVTELGRAASTQPDAARRLVEAKKHLETLNPLAGKLAELAAEYCQELALALKLSPDSLTGEDVAERLSALRLDRFVPPEKLPKVNPPPPPLTVTAPPRKSISGVVHGPGARKQDQPPKEFAMVVPPDVERALRAAGWTTIMGTWRQVKANVYEVTDGYLAAPRTAGRASVTVHGGGTGSVGLYARYNPQAVAEPTGYDVHSLTDSPYGPGFGILLEGNDLRLYGPRLFNSRPIPYPERAAPVPPGTKHTLALRSASTPQGLALEYTVDGRPQYSGLGRAAHDGPFLLQVWGTATIEEPRVSGQ